MNKSISFKKKLYNFVFIIFSCFIFLYISYFLIFSNKGTLNYFILKNNVNNKNLLYEEFSSTNEKLINNINKLKLNDIDLDYLEELNIKTNGYLNNNDIVVILSESEY